jgi:hypothetical protein
MRHTILLWDTILMRHTILLWHTILMRHTILLWDHRRIVLVWLLQMVHFHPIVNSWRYFWI